MLATSAPWKRVLATSAPWKRISLYSFYPANDLVCGSFSKTPYYLLTLFFVPDAQMTRKDPVRTLDKASPVWTLPTVILASLVAFGAWCMYYNKFPAIAETTPFTSSTEPLFDWEHNKPKAVGLVLLVVGFLTLIIGWITSIRVLLIDKPLPPLAMDASVLPLLILIPLLTYIIYKFGTGTTFSHLAALIMASVAISAAALISSQSQVNA